MLYLAERQLLFTAKGNFPPRSPPPPFFRTTLFNKFLFLFSTAGRVLFLDGGDGKPSQVVCSIVCFFSSALFSIDLPLKRAFAQSVCCGFLFCFGCDRGVKQIRAAAEGPRDVCMQCSFVRSMRNSCQTTSSPVWLGESK